MCHPAFLFSSDLTRRVQVRFRRFVSLSVFLSFVSVVLTGIVLFIVPQGRVAYWAGWSLLGLSKEDWGSLHINLTVLFLIVGAIHIWYNWRPIKAYLSTRARRLVVMTREFVVALVLLILFAAGTIAGAPPFAWVLDLNHEVKATAARQYGEPPYGHAEATPLRAFARRMNLDPRETTEALEAAGYRVEDPSLPLMAIAEANQTTPQALWTAIQAAQAAPGGQEAPSMPVEPRPGTGRRTLADIFEEYGLDPEDAMTLLAEKGIEAGEGERLRDIAEQNGVDPHAIWGILQDWAASRGEEDR
jgi:hypothetical protein